jgi:hypothetical protein
MSILRFWRAFKRARSYGFPIYEAYLAAKANAR